MQDRTEIIETTTTPTTRVPRTTTEVRSVERPAAEVDRMESVEIIDRQIKFYNELLGRLT